MGGRAPLGLQAPRVLRWGPHLPQGATSLSEPHVPNAQGTWTLGSRPASVGSLLPGLQPRAGWPHVEKSREEEGGQS